KSTLVGLRDHFLGVLEISPGIEVEEHINSVRVQVGDQGRKFALVSYGIDAVKRRLEGRHTFLVDSIFVDTARVIIADLLLVGSRVACARRVLQNVPQESAVPLVQFIETPPRRLVRRDWVALLPAAASVLVKINARVCSLVERRRVKA